MGQIMRGGYEVAYMEGEYGGREMRNVIDGEHGADYEGRV